MTNEAFKKIAGETLAKMEEMSKKLGITGVACVASLEDENTPDWITEMKVCGRIRSPITNDGEKGWNLVAIVYSKAGEMMDTKQNSGSKVRPLLHGELGFTGGAVKKCGKGYVVAAFSGGASEQDFEVSQAAVDFMCK